MERSRAGLVKWALSKADEYLQSASDNLKAERLFPAAEEIFRAVETALEALLYHYGIRKIEYPGTDRKFTGRLALQFLVRDNLVHPGRLDRAAYDKYLALASELHLAGYQHTTIFEKGELETNLRFAENLLTKVRSTVGR
jgi:uncharacterized protein (UPF0332 family)